MQNRLSSVVATFFALGATGAGAIHLVHENDKARHFHTQRNTKNNSNSEVSSPCDNSTRKYCGGLGHI